jgi:hypothetical protein
VCCVQRHGVALPKLFWRPQAYRVTLGQSQEFFSTFAIVLCLHARTAHMLHYTTVSVTLDTSVEVALTGLFASTVKQSLEGRCTFRERSRRTKCATFSHVRAAFGMSPCSQCHVAHLCASYQPCVHVLCGSSYANEMPQASVWAGQTGVAHSFRGAVNCT